MKSQQFGMSTAYHHASSRTGSHSAAVTIRIRRTINMYWCGVRRTRTIYENSTSIALINIITDDFRHRSYHHVVPNLYSE